MWRKKFLYPGMIAVGVGAISASPMIYFGIKNREKGDIESFHKETLRKIETEFFDKVLYFSPVDINYNVKSKLEAEKIREDEEKILLASNNEVVHEENIYGEHLMFTKAMYQLFIDILRLQKLDDLTLSNYQKQLKSLLNKMKIHPDDPLNPKLNFNNNIFKEDTFKETIKNIFGEMKSWNFNEVSEKKGTTEAEFVSWCEMFEKYDGKEIPNTKEGDDLKIFITSFMNTITSMFGENNLFELAKSLDSNTGGIEVRFIDQIIELLDAKRYSFGEDLPSSYDPENPIYKKKGSATLPTLESFVDQYLARLKPLSSETTIYNMVNNFQAWFKNELRNPKNNKLPKLPVINAYSTMLLINKFLLKEADLAGIPKAKEDVDKWMTKFMEILNNNKFLPSLPDLGVTSWKSVTFDDYDKFLEKSNNFNHLKGGVQYKLFRIGFSYSELNKFIDKYNVKDDFIVRVDKWTPRYITIDDMKKIMANKENGETQYFDEVDGYIYPKMMNSKWSIRTYEEINLEKLSFNEDSTLDSLNEKAINHFIFVPTWSVKKVHNNISVDFTLESTFSDVNKEDKNA